MNKFLAVPLLAIVGLFLFVGSAPSAVKAAVGRSVVRLEIDIEGSDSIGTCGGVVISASQGIVLTAAHCLPKNTKTFTVDGKLSRILKRSESLALVSIEPLTRAPIELAPKAAETLDPVVSVGFGYAATTPVYLYRYVAYILHQDFALDGVLIPGMSGGPILDLQGRLVGINQWSNDSVSGGCGLDEIKDFIKQ